MPIDPSDRRALVLDEDTGEAFIRIEATTWTIQPPLLGTLRQLDLLAAKLERDGQAKLEAAAQAAEPEDVPADVAEAIAQPSLHEQVAQVLPWWRLLFERCADNPLPEDDGCPLWMGSTLLVARMIVHWQLYPLRALGSGGLPLLEAANTVQQMLTPGDRLPTGNVT